MRCSDVPLVFVTWIPTCTLSWRLYFSLERPSDSLWWFRISRRVWVLPVHLRVHFLCTFYPHGSFCVSWKSRKLLFSFLRVWVQGKKSEHTYYYCLDFRSWSLDRDPLSIRVLCRFFFILEDIVLSLCECVCVYSVFLSTHMACVVLYYVIYASK